MIPRLRRYADDLAARVFKGPSLAFFLFSLIRNGLDREITRRAYNQGDFPGKPTGDMVRLKWQIFHTWEKYGYHAFRKKT